MNLSNIAILNIQGVFKVQVTILNIDYHCIINGISKSEAINLLQKHEKHKFHHSKSLILLEDVDI